MRTITMALLTCAFALAADSPFVGTWTMNKAKSDFGPQGPKMESLTIQYVQDGPALQAIMTTNGRPEPGIVIDGKEHVVTGRTRMEATHATATVKGRMIETSFTKDGKTVGTRKYSLSADGKVLTAVTVATTPDGQKVHWNPVFDKQ